MSPLADKQFFLDALQGAGSIKELLENAGLRAAGGNYGTARKYAAIHGIQLPKMERRQRAKFMHKGPRPYDEILVEDSDYSRHALKLRLIQDEIIVHRCGGCGNEGVWEGGPLSLQLDHVNGVYNDNRIENLRFLCPNCHSQTDTFAGKNR